MRGPKNRKISPKITRTKPCDWFTKYRLKIWNCSTNIFYYPIFRIDFFYYPDYLQEKLVVRVNIFEPRLFRFTIINTWRRSQDNIILTRSMPSCYISNICRMKPFFNINSYDFVSIIFEIS